MNEKSEFAVKTLNQYAKENQVPARSTSDLSRLEEWLIVQINSEEKKQRLLDQWIYSGDTGASSETIWAVIKGLESDCYLPYDSLDFGRCYHLVKKCGLSKKDLEKVSQIHVEWKPFIDNWDKLEKMYESTVDENFKSKRFRTKDNESSRMYYFMKNLRDKTNKK
jgi:ubiquitin